MTLEDVVRDLENIDDLLTICAARSPNWSPSSEVELLPAEEVDHTSRLPYFLEIFLAKDVVGAWSYVRRGEVPSLEQKCEAIIYYAENDAYIP